MRPAQTAFLVLAILAAGCSDDKSYAVVSVLSSDHPLPNVAQLRVTVTTGQNREYHQQLFFPDKPLPATALLQLDLTTPITFSVSFRTMFKGDVIFEVEPLDATQTLLGRGTSAAQPINVGKVTYANVTVVPTCDPLASANTCGANQTCALVCDAQSRPQMACFPAGLKNPGELCTDVSDCLPGSECFEFKACSSAQPIKTCRVFCNSDTACGLGSTCSTNVSCDATSTAFKLCSRPCDPTGPATGGCAAGLYCFLYAAETTDCACRDASRVGVVATPCSTDADCQPGLMCVDRAGSKTCQTICQIASPSCPTGTKCTTLTNPDYKTFGACL
jgi:hypothetical protein